MKAVNGSVVKVSVKARLRLYKVFKRVCMSDRTTLLFQLCYVSSKKVISVELLVSLCFLNWGGNGEDAKNNSTNDWENAVVRTFIIEVFIVTSKMKIALGTRPSF